MAIPGNKSSRPINSSRCKGFACGICKRRGSRHLFEHKSLYAIKGEVPEGEHVDTLGTAKVVRPGKDATIVALALMVPRAIQAADKLMTDHGIDVEVVDIRTLVPLDMKTISSSVAKTGRLFTVEENPRLCGWGAGNCLDS